MPTKALEAATDSAKTAYDHAGRAVDAAREALEAGRRAFPDLIGEAQRLVGHRVDKLSDQGREAADTAADRFDDAKDYVFDRVHEQPIGATLAALGVGFLIGLLFAGRRK